MQRLHLHWAGGAYKANAINQATCHVLVDGTPKLVRGKHPISANEKPGMAGTYAAHTLNANNGAIGRSICCMGGKGVGMANHGSYPLKRDQWELAAKAAAQLCDRKGIPVTDTTVLTPQRPDRRASRLRQALPRQVSRRLRRWSVWDHDSAFPYAHILCRCNDPTLLQKTFAITDRLR